MSQKLSSVAAGAAKYLKRNGGQYEVELSSIQRVNISAMLSAIGEFDGCRYITRKIDGGRFAIVRIEL